ncbi:MAG TPA: tetratricopeptide repeat protein, partial [Gemmataceae bacterium]|nr:tetratricopeptide repeat protein [Gemmataceae bacterium]
ADRYAQALRLLDFAPRLDYSTRAYHVQRAALLERVGRGAEAAQERACAQQAQPQTALDRFLTGEALYRAGRAPQAAAEFEKALALRPDAFWSRFYLSLCHLRLQRWEAARAGLNACLVQEPDFVWIYLFRSVANERLRAFAAARADFEQALRLHPDGDARYVLLINRGVLEFEQKNLDRAAQDFRQAADLKPDQYNARLNLARVYLAQHQFTAAAAEMDRVMRLGPPPMVVAAYHLERARTFYADQKYAAAADASATALQLLPGEPEALRLAGLALLSLGRYDEAVKALDQYIRHSGKPDGDVFRARGQARMKMALYLEAVDDYSHALQLQPTADLYLHRGWAYFFADGWRLARRDFARAVEMQPTNPDAFTGRGLARVMLGDYQTAAEDAEQALRLRPATPEMMHNIACIFAQALAQSERSQREQRKSTLGLHYQRRALQTLHQAILMVTPNGRAKFWRGKIAPDAALNPVRDCPEFQHLAAFALAGHKSSE